MGLVLLWGGLICQATDVHFNIGDYTIDVWQVEQGLPQMSVTSIAQTPNGYLWLGTFHGLVRFDGVRFTVFNEANTPALGSSRIVRLLTDEQGALWILAEEGHVACLANDRFTAYGPENGLPASGAAALVVDLEGHLLVIDRDGGLHATEHRQMSRVDLEEGELSPARRFLVAPSEPCWAVQSGLAVNCSNVPLSFPSQVSEGKGSVGIKIPCAAPCRAGGHWLATASGLFHLRDGLLQETVVPYPEPISALTAIAEDRGGNLWVGSWSLGLFRCSPARRWQRFCAGSGLTENDVTALFVDRENNLWVGTSTGGLHRFKPASFRSYDTSQGLSNDNVRSIAEDRAGRIWMGVNGGGLHCWNEGQITPVTEPPEIKRYPLIYSVLSDRHDAVWMGVYGGTVLRLQNGALTAYSFTGQSPLMTPRALFEDRAGTLWLGCDGGLLRYEAEHFTVFNRENGTGHELVRALAQDGHGTLYIGTQGGGLDYFANDVFGVYTQRDGLPDDHIETLWVDGDDILWIGTLHGGLVRLHQGRFAKITTRDGLPSNTIGSILEDDLGNLWLGSNRGIVRICRQELNDYLDGGRRTLTCRVFDCSDGLNTVDCSGGQQPASCKARDGRLWFATVKGAAVVDPTQVPLNSLSPPVVIEEVLLNDAPIFSNGSNRVLTRDSAEGLRIPPGRHRLEVRFTGVSLEAPEKVRFRYRLAGLNPDWIDSGPRRTASFGQVPHGTYRFEMTACNKDGIWNEQGAMLSITVLPYFWETTWFKILFVSILCIGTASLVRLAYFRRMERRIERMESRYALESERSRIARDIHDDLGARLTQIGLMAELAKRNVEKPDETRLYLDQMAQRSRGLTQAMDEVVWAVDPTKDSVEGLLNYLGPVTQESFQGTNISCRLDFPPVLPPQSISAKARHGILLVVKEALNNSVKHSNASEVLIRSNLRGSELSLQIEDNGCGFSHRNAESHRVGHGIQNMRDRVEDLGGEFRIDSPNGIGTRVVIKIDLARNS